MLSIRRAIRVGGAAILLVSGVAVGVLSSGPTASASGFAWSIVTSPNLSPGQAQSNELNAVSCSGPSACVAVGLYVTPQSYPPLAQTLIESWNGSAWSIVPSPNTSPTQYNQLSAVSCSGPSACVAVGYQSSASTVQQTLIESWNGSAWSIVPSPNTSPTQVNVLQAVSCNLPSACVAVGQYYPSSGDFSQTLIESWNGSAWSIVPSPNTSPTQINLLGGVSCSSPSACTAVGNFEAGISAAQTLVESWNGSAWSIVPSPNSSPTQNNWLFGVSCSSPSACTAVGYYSTASTEQTLIESWNGSAWSIVTSPNTSPSEVTLLLGVSCGSSSACTAVGGYNGTGTLVERGTLSTTTSVLIPSSGATLSGSTYLDAAASNATSVQFWLFGGSYGYSGHLVGTATPTYYGWLYSWNTTTVPNGSYALLSKAFGPGGSAFSSHVSITVNNAPPPATSVIIPSNGATLSGTMTALDAAASNATSVEFRLFGGSFGYNAPVLCTATLTQYGWLCSWDSTTVPNGSYALLSEAFNSSGSAYSAPISISVSNLPVTNYTDPSISAPFDIATGPDGALWFTNAGNNSIGRITTSGVVTSYPVCGEPQDITAGPDGALWFTAIVNNSSTPGAIGRITTGGVVTCYSTGIGLGFSGPGDITVGPDGALWFTNSTPRFSSIGRVTTSGAVTNHTDPSISGPSGITAGPDGALWFTNNVTNSIGRITTSGVVTNYTDPSIAGPGDISAGPDGALWFTNSTPRFSSIGRITTSGAVTNHTDPSISGPSGITAGPDGALWLTNNVTNSIGRISTSGVVTNYTDPSIGSPQRITAGPDGALWFTNYANNSIGRISP